MSKLDDLRALQAGVLSRAQLLDHEVTEPAIRRQLRRRELVAMLPGVYVDHTGEPTWVQRAWAAVLALEPAALCHQSAMHAAAGPGSRGDDGPIHVAVGRNRSPAAPPGVRLHHLTRLDDIVQWNLSPPRVRVEEVLLTLAAEASDDLTAIATLADAVQARRTTPARLQAGLAQRSRTPRRALLAGCLRDIDDGACSALEQAYLDRVERAHGLPTAGRQVRESRRGPVYRDVEYAEQAVLVELDGRAFHNGASSRDRDMERDLNAALEGCLTVRLGWGQVVGRPCATARKREGPAVQARVGRSCASVSELLGRRRGCAVRGCHRVTATYGTVGAMAKNIATTDRVDLDGLLEFVRPRHRLIFVTRKRDGGPQMSPVTGGVDDEGRIVISTYPERAKANNARRDAAVSVMVLSDEFDDKWVQVDGTCEVIDMPDAVEPLVDYFRSISGEHDDWDEYREAMRKQGKSLLRITPTGWGPIATGGFPPRFADD